MRRAFDLIYACLGLALLWPVFVVVALLIKRHDGGTVFFRQQRIGRHGHTFRIWKFRTMVPDAERVGLALTTEGDARITPLGHWLRKLKIDELPQLFNVLAGEMGFVGPRPEVPKYVACYTADQRRVLDLRPGITDPASLKYVDESELLAAAADVQRTYVEQIMPDKIRLNLEYAESANVWTDFLFIAKTVFALASPARRRKAAGGSLRKQAA